MIVSLVFDNIHFDTFELGKYELAVDGLTGNYGAAMIHCQRPGLT